VNRFKTEQVVDVFQTIKSIRAQNPAAVQTLVRAYFYHNITFNSLFIQEQYEFIHQVIVALTEQS